MAQLIGVMITLVAIAILGYWVWKTWYSTIAVPAIPATPTTPTTPTQQNIIAGTLESAHLVTNLGYIELLSKVDVVAASPDAVKACDTLANVLWQGTIEAWKTAQAATTTPATVIDPIKTAKVTTIDGTVVEVPVQ